MFTYLITLTATDTKNGASQVTHRLRTAQTLAAAQAHAETQCALANAALPDVTGVVTDIAPYHEVDMSAACAFLAQGLECAGHVPAEDLPA